MNQRDPFDSVMGPQSRDDMDHDPTDPEPEEDTPNKPYPHMCRDGHKEIGHRDSEQEQCPLCRIKAERDELLKVMRWYAHPRNWGAMGHGAYADIGNRAREILHKLEK